MTSLDTWTPMDYPTGGDMQRAPTGGGSNAASTLAYAGAGMQLIGTVQSAISGYYAARLRTTQLRAEASAFRFQQTLSNINARIAEQQASEVLEAAQFEREKVGLVQRQEVGTARVTAAARGVEAGVGSAAEVEASIRLVRDIDKRVITANAARQVRDVRTQARNLRMQGVVHGISAGRAASAARSISPGMEAVTSLMSGAPQTAYAFSYAAGL